MAMAAGAVAGLLDALTSPPPPTGALSAAFWTASVGALLGLAGFLPVAVVLALLRRPRSAAGAPAVAGALLLATPACVAVGRHLFRRLPWSGGDWVLAAAAVFALLALVAVAAIAAARVPAARGESIARGFARAFVPALLLALPSGGRLAASLRPGEPPRGEPGGANLLLLTVDTLRPDALGCTGSPFARTPWLDRIARTSVTFSDCVAASPWTLPSLGTVLTGSYPGDHRVLEALSGISPDVTTLAEVARRGGRRTAAFVSNPWLATGGLARGFETFDVAERLDWIPAVRQTRINAVVTKTVLRLGRLDAADRIVAGGISWIRRGRGSWFLWLHLFDPHLPNRNAPPYDRLFGPPPVHARYEQEVEDIRAGRFGGGEEGRAEIERLYHGEVAFTDRAVGRLWRALDESGELGRTAVVFAADHGEELWDHGGYGHGHEMFDEVVRVPFFVRPAGGDPGRVVGELTALVDLAPTALDVAGIAVPEGAFRGTDRLAAGAPARTATYGEATLYGGEQKYLRTPRWMLVLRLPEGDAGPPDERSAPDEPPSGGKEAGATLHLFDLWHDPGERTDLAGAEPARTDSLRAVLEAWRAAVGSAGAMAARNLPDDVDPATRAQLEALGYLQ